jgi:hypothetical protein
MSMIFKQFLRLNAAMIVLVGGGAFAAEEPIAEDAGGDGGLMDQSVPVAEEDAAADAAAQAGPPRLRKAYLREELLDEFGNYKRLMSEGIYDEARLRTSESCSIATSNSTPPNKTSNPRSTLLKISKTALTTA